MPDWSKINQHISEATGQPFSADSAKTVSGGSINSAYLLNGADGRTFFAKVNSASLVEMFEAEAAGLSEMLATNSIKVPAPICWGSNHYDAYIVMDYIPMEGSGSSSKLGQQLAAMHRTQSEKFGWFRDNTIGSTPQINTFSSSWVEFYREHRLRFQLQLAARKGGEILLRQGERLLEVLEVFFTDYQPVPSLLHGDLWGGNYATDDQGNPIIFDPAVYYGDRESDIAMTELFGGFSPDFYLSYNESWPLDVGYDTRKTLYNLYHVLNHFNLFGGGYLSQANDMISSLMSETR